MKRMFCGVKLFMKLTVLLLRKLTLPEIKTCETADELKRFIAPTVRYRSVLNLSACLFYNVLSKQILTILIRVKFINV